MQNYNMIFYQLSIFTVMITGRGYFYPLITVLPTSGIKLYMGNEHIYANIHVHPSVKIFRLNFQNY